MRLKIKKIGINRLVLYIPKKIREKLLFTNGEVIILELKKEKKKIVSISKMNYLITIKKEVINYLSLKEGENLDVTFSSFSKVNKPEMFLRGNKIDLLFFIPDKTTKGSEIFAEEIIKNSEPYLRICSFHKKGSSRQLEVKRFLDPYTFGKFLGQLQAEGTKANMGKVEFCNKSLYEHKEFLDFLIYLGIPLEKIFTKFDYHPSIGNIEGQINKFKDFLRLPLNYISFSDKSRGGSGFKILVRSETFNEIILNALHYLREYLTQNLFKGNLEIFANGFFIKLLSGDGSFEIITKNRNIPQARLIIYDGNITFLEDYRLIMEKYGFIPKVNQKGKYVRSYCNLNLAKRLLEINAFENNPNHKKLKNFIRLRDLAN